MKTFLVLVSCLLVIAQVTAFTVNGVQVIEYLTPAEEAEYMRQEHATFDFFNSDKNGYIDVTEIEAQNRKWNEIYKYRTEESILYHSRLFITERDADGDGKVTFDEYFMADLSRDGLLSEPF